MFSERPFVISVAGFDPSGGAGLLSDAKTFEQVGVQGLGVCSAITVQTAELFERVHWVATTIIKEQLALLLQQYPVRFLKVGIVESFEVLHELLMYLERSFPHVKVIWDPVIKSTTGFAFHAAIDKTSFLECCRHIYLITPNADEAKELMNETDAVTAAMQLQLLTNVLLKSCKLQDGSIGDLLLAYGERHELRASLLNGYAKHGSGCVLSSAITANLALDNDLYQSCRLAKAYTLAYLKSSPGLLGIHQSIKSERIDA